MPPEISETTKSTRNAIDRLRTATPRAAWAKLENDAGEVNPALRLTHLTLILKRPAERERAFDSLEQAYKDRHPGMILLKYDPRFDPLRGDPRFTKLIQRIEQPS